MSASAKSGIVKVYDQTLSYLLGPVSGLLDDDSVSEIMINGYQEIYVERKGKLEKTDLSFADEIELEAAARNIAQFVGKRLSKDNPSIEARLPNGSRVHIVLPPAARKGICIAIRKFSRQTLTIEDIVEGGSLTEESAEYLSICVALARNIMVSGGTGSGKTTLLNCLSAMIPEGERIIVLEDSSELQLQQEHVVSFEAQPADRNGRGGLSIRDLFRASLRLRPDRIVVGECRGGEALDMIQAMTSGHDGSMSTCHSNTPSDALNRIETMSMMSGVEIPLIALRSQIASGLDLIIQINRFHDGSRKITHITEVISLEDNGKYTLSDMFLMKQKKGQGSKDGRLAWTKTKSVFASHSSLADFPNLIHKTKSLW